MAVVAIDSGNLKIVVFIGSASFEHMIDVIADDARMLYFVVAGQPYLRKCIGTVGDSFFTVFCLSRIERCIEICAVLQENRLKC